MEIRTLAQTPVGDIAAAFNLAFSDYFVPVTATEAALQNRWTGARVDLGLSFGAFENGQLAGFILTGADQLHGQKTAYNAGTGVIPAFRGRKLVAALYEVALPAFRRAGITQSTLEVISENAKAIKAYQNVGFKITRTLHCYKVNIALPATFSPDPDQQITVSRHFDPETLTPLQPFDFSWDNCNAGIRAQAGNFELWQLREEAEPQAYLILNPATGYLAQFGFRPNGSLNPAKTLLSEAAKTIPALRINNVDSTAHQAKELLQTAGLQNYLDQYEMLLQLH